MPPRKRTTRASKKAEAEEAAMQQSATQQEDTEMAESVAEAPAEAKTEPEPSAEPTAEEETKPAEDVAQAEAESEVTAEPAAEEDVPKEDAPKASTRGKGKGKGKAEAEAEPEAEPATKDSSTKSTETPAPAPAPAAAPSVADRMARFKALQARAKASSDQNLKAAAAETQRVSTDSSQLTSLRRKHDIAAHKLLKAEIEEAGGDFERKRAWDWTVEDSERWDKRMAKRAAHRDNAAFQDYTQEANKVYKKQIRNAGILANPNMEQYARDKLAAIEKAAAEGTLEIVETADGELIAVDKEGTFFSTAESTSFADNKPSKEAIDRLVNDQRKADEASLRKRRERLAKNGDDADVTYINEKNKHFNQKLARFYDKYTTEIRDSFERGTMI